MNILIEDIDRLIVDLLDLPELLTMISVNKFFHGIINGKPIIYQHRIMEKYQTDYTTLFIRACERGFLLYAKFLIDRYPDINIYARENHAFRWSCQNGHLETTKWLISVDKSFYINIHDQCEDAFIWSCNNGHFDVVKWLIEFGESSEVYRKIKIHMDDNDAFNYSCEMGHLDIAKYLIGLGENDYGHINIHESSDYAFRYACVNGHLDVSQYIYHLSKNGYGDININFQQLINKCPTNTKQWLQTLVNPN